MNKTEIKALDTTFKSLSDRVTTLENTIYISPGVIDEILTGEKPKEQTYAEELLWHKSKQIESLKKDKQELQFKLDLLINELLEAKSELQFIKAMETDHD